MTDNDARQIIIAFTAIVLAWSIASLLTIAFGRPFPSELVVTLADPPEWLGDRLPCNSGR